MAGWGFGFAAGRFSFHPARLVSLCFIHAGNRGISMGCIAFLGTGNMGIGMAAQLIKAGHSVRAYNRTRSKADPLAERGATVAETAREAADNADVVMSMVGDDTASRAVWLGDSGALAATPSPDRLIIECSTLSHDWALELSETVKKDGMRYLDCPVTGLPDAAAKGELTLFLGGDEATIAQAQPYLQPISARQIHFGGIGSGTAYKLIVNLMGSIQIAATAEALVVAEKAGLDLDKVADALATGGAGSPNVARNAKLMAAGEHEKDVQFNANWRLKDTRYGVEFAQKVDQTSALGTVAFDMFQELVDAGHANSAESKVIETLRQ